MKYPMRAIAIFLATISAEAALAASYDATVVFGRRVELSLPVSGIVQVANVTTGQNVSAGQILIALDDTLFLASVAQAEAEVARCDADRTVTTRDYQQARQLHERAVLSNVELENAKLNADRADATCRQAQARLTHAKYELEHSKIAAPFDGWVLDMRARAGESVNSTTEVRPLLVLAEAGEYIARLRISVKLAAILQIGRPAQVLVDGQKFAGWIVTTALEPVGRDSSNTRYEIDIAFNTGNLLLRGGQSARVEFE